MTKIAVWCRHEGDNIIGVDGKIPWNVPSDSNRFWRLCAEMYMVCGRKTYESLPQKEKAAHKIFVLTQNSEYKTENENLHFAVNKLKFFKDFEENLCISGGAEIYNLFMEKMPPEIVVDCVFEGDIKTPKAGQKVAQIGRSVEIMQQKYRKIGADATIDNVRVSVWMKKGEFVDQKCLKFVLENYV
jgi:dihydrofolate reductase